MTIHDEFTNLPVSNSQKYNLRNKEKIRAYKKEYERSHQWDLLRKLKDKPVIKEGLI